MATDNGRHTTTGSPAPAELPLFTEPIAAIVGPTHLRLATPEDAIDGVQPQCVVEPADEQEVARVLAHCSEQDLAVAPRGGGTKLGWGNPPSRVDVVLSLARLNGLVEHAAGDMTATVQAGMTLTALQAKLAEAGQTLALDVSDADRATIGGLIATNDSGALRLRYGGIRDQLLGITFVRSDGVTAHGGGRVVKNVAGYDMPKLLTGALGALGVITQATFRLYPLPAARRTLETTVSSVAAGGALILEALRFSLEPVALSLYADSERSARVSVTFAGVPEAVQAQTEAWERLAPSAGPSPAGDPAATRQPAERVIIKLSVLPTEITPSVSAAVLLGEAQGWHTEVLLHAHGLGHVTWSGVGAAEPVIEAIQALRDRIGDRAGTAVVQQAPLAVKRALDVWGPATDAVPLMRRVKAELDPRGILNPGRLIGGI